MNVAPRRRCRCRRPFQRRCHWPFRRRVGGERGGASVEMVVLTPALLLVLLLVVAAGRVGEAHLMVRSAAEDAARAASLRQETRDGERDAVEAAQRSVRSGGVACRNLATDVDTGGLPRGGTVRVTVRCVVELADLGLLGLPHRRTISATAVEVVDRYRSD